MLSNVYTILRCLDKIPYEKYVYYCIIKMWFDESWRGWLLNSLNENVNVNDCPQQQDNRTSTEFIQLIHSIRVICSDTRV